MDELPPPVANDEPRAAVIGLGIGVLCFFAIASGLGAAGLNGAVATGTAIAAGVAVSMFWPVLWARRRRDRVEPDQPEAKNIR